MEPRIYANLREWDFLGKVPCVPEGQGTVAGDDIEFAVLLAVEVVAKDVGGEEVGGELEAFEAAADGIGEGVGKSGLAEAGRAGDEGVAPGEEGGKEKIDGLVGAEDGVEEALLEGLDGGSGHEVSLTIEVGMRNEEASVGIVKLRQTYPSKVSDY